MRHEQLNRPESFDIVDPAAAIPGTATPQPERAVPDVPAAVGGLFVVVYTSIVGILAFTVANRGNAPLMIAVDLFFLAAFFCVPAILLKIERDPARRPTFDRFMRQGMQTFTGDVSGGGALAQMFVVPVLLAFGVLAIGIIAMTV